MKHHVTKGMPAYEQRRKDRNYTSRYRLCGAKFETLSCHELRTGEAGHHWLPTTDDIHEVWECRVEDPTAPWYVSYAPERSPPLKKETPREKQSYEILHVRLVPQHGQTAGGNGESRRQATNHNTREL